MKFFGTIKVKYFDSNLATTIKMVRTENQVYYKFLFVDCISLMMGWDTGPGCREGGGDHSPVL